MKHILAAGREFTAVLASNDDSAFGAMQALQEAGLRIPQDVAIIGFDDRPEAAAQNPPLTTIHYSMPEIGYRAVNLLVEHLEDHTEKTIAAIPVWLVTRDSCGCPSTLRAPEQLAEDAPQTTTSLVAREMANAVIAEALHLGPYEVHTLCQHLASAFESSAEHDEESSFSQALQETLRRVAETDDDPHVWQRAISILRLRSPLLLEAEPLPTASRRMEDLLDQARAAISERTRRQHRQYIISHRRMTDRLGLMTARLLAALNEPQIFETLQEYLPGTGIKHADVAFLQAEGNDPAAWSLLQTRAGQGPSNHFPSRRFPPDGLYPADEPFSLALLPLDIHEDVSGYAAFDAGQLEPLAAIVRQLAAALRSARLYREAAEGRRLAEEANRLKSRFLSTVSHELRTPLTLVVSLSEMLLREEAQGELPLPDPHRQDLERIHASAQHLDGLIHDVLDLARSEMGRLQLICEPLDLTVLLRSVAAVGERMAHDKALAWEAHIPADLPLAWGDRTRLRQVALNLISNAVKFTSKGKVALTVQTRTQDTDHRAQDAHREPPAASVQLKAETTGGLGAPRGGLPPKCASAGDARFITVSVSDTGLGIPLAEQESIFDEFRQSERTATRGYGGLGLGLAICRRLVEMHDGKIWAESSGEEGGGSVFTFELPAMEVLPPEMEEMRRAREQTVLLLTDKMGAEEHLREHLVRQGFKVEAERYHPDETTDWLSRVLSAPPGAVVLDLEPASEQGWEVLKAIKRNPATRDVPVLFFALAQERDGGAVLEMDYLTKPLRATELVHALIRQGLQMDAGELRSILIVDDEPGVLEMHTRVVEAQLPDCRILNARNGREALDFIQRERPNLVLLDLMMPELDGFGVLEAMHADRAMRDIPVVVLTGQELTEEDMRRLNQGVAAVLGKGLFTVKETLAHVEAALARTRRAGTEAKSVARRAMAFMHEHYAEPISRSDVADHVGVSERHLTRCFREETDITPIAYLNRCRVRQAKAMLEEGKSVTETAIAVGFSDPAYFSRVFRRETGVTPSTFQRAD
jgi:signal transduction histidine kinase/DNA-binding response OmpR family regulator